MRGPARLSLLGALLSASSLVSGAGCDRGGLTEDQVAALTHGGHARRGAAAIQRFGCGACHAIPGIPGAAGQVGPPLAGLGGRSYVAGVLTNTPEHLVQWIVNPPAVDSLTAMPNLGVTPGEARDIAAYLYSRR
jgi:cytochrome c